MRDHYDFSKMKARMNPYARHLYLRDCAVRKKELFMRWRAPRTRTGK